MEFGFYCFPRRERFDFCLDLFVCLLCQEDYDDYYCDKNGLDLGIIRIWI